MVHVDLPEQTLQPDNVRDALAGRLPRLSPTAALKLLPDLDIPTADRQTLLRETVENTTLPSHIRAAAVRASLYQAGESALATIVDALTTGEERVTATAAAALGQIGTPDHLPALRRARQHATADLTRRRTAFAETLITHRFGITDAAPTFDDIDTQPAPVAIGASSFSSGRPGAERRRRALDGIRRELPWLDPARQDVYELQCGPRLMEVAVDRDYTDPQGLRALTERPALPAVIAYQSPEHDDFHPALLILSRPGGANQIGLVITRLGGEPAYIAEGALDNGEAVFELRSAHAGGIAAVTSRIRITARGVEIAGFSDRSAVTAREPRRADPPS